MNFINPAKRQSYLTVVLALVIIAASFVIYVPQAEAAMGFRWFEPAATLISSSDSGDYYKVNDTIAPDKVHFKWNFSNGMDRPIGGGSLQYVKLRNKTTNEVISLSGVGKCRLAAFLR